MQTKPNVNDIPKLVQEYNTSIQYYLYYHWIQQSTFLKVPSYALVVAWVVDFFIFHDSHLEIHSHSMHITIDVTLDWKNFIEFYKVFVSTKKLETYAIELYPDLTHLLISWSSYKKHIFVLLIGPKQTLLSPWRLGLGIIRLEMNVLM